MKEKSDMANNDKYIDCSIEMSDAIKPFIEVATNGKRYLKFRVAANKNGADKYGKTHNISIRYKATDGNYYTMYIGKGTERTFGQNQGAGAVPPPPAPRQSAPGNPVVAAGAMAALAQKPLGAIPAEAVAPKPHPVIDSGEDIPF